MVGCFVSVGYLAVAGPRVRFLNLAIAGRHLLRICRIVTVASWGCTSDPRFVRQV